jgi:DNA-binding NtrC family response regulator
MSDAAVADRTILLIDDDADLLAALARLFHRSGWQVVCAQDGAAALATFAVHRPEVVIQDLQLPGPSGLDLLGRLRRSDPDAAIIVLTGYGDVAIAVEAMHLGAADFLTKPASYEQLARVAQAVHERVQLRRLSRHREASTPATAATAALGTSVVMREVARQVELLGRTESTVLLQGETGTGKSWTARLIHALSGRAKGPFVEINCASLNATFLDSELFGHERGAFTDAKAQKQGLMELAHRGTLFLDEIGDLAPELQPKLLKVLEGRRFRRLGGTREIEVDIRLITATHRALEDEVRAGRFREDLFYRLSVLPVRLPPLRERSAADVGTLVRDAADEIARRLGREPLAISDQAMRALTRHGWPGNIRELRNVLERILLTTGEAREIGPQHMPPGFDGEAAPQRVDTGDVELPLLEIERLHIERVLAHCEGNRARTARVLGIGRRTLYDKIERYRL